MNFQEGQEIKIMTPDGRVLSHANKHIQYMNAYGGEGELWKVRVNGLHFIFEAMGGESGLFLSHAYNKLQLTNGNHGNPEEGEYWKLIQVTNGDYVLEGAGGESGNHLLNSTQENQELHSEGYCGSDCHWRFE